MRTVILRFRATNLPAFAARLRGGVQLRWLIVSVGAVLSVAGLVIPLACSRSNPTQCGEGAACESTKGAADTEKGPAADRKHAGRLMDAAQQCEDDMQADPPPAACFVVVSWQANRRISYQEAIELARKLRRASLGAAIEQASGKPYTPYSEQACNWYLGAVGKILDIPYFRDRSYDGSHDEKLRTADTMNEFLTRAVTDPIKTGWRQVGVGVDPGPAVTDLVNEGHFVVASAHSVPGKTEYGHIALAAPDYLPQESDPAIAGRTGPWIRYAVYGGAPHTTKSTRTSIIFGSSVTPPIWVEYVGSDWLAAPGEKKLPCVDLDGDGLCDPLNTSGTPPEPTKYCVSCPLPGYHCEQNPPRCVRDATSPQTTNPTTKPPVTTKPTTPPTTKPTTPPTTKPTTPPTTKPTTKPTTPPTTPPTTTQHSA